MAEYDDDYDDQYDHMDGFGVNDGNMTQEEVREYNKVRRAEEGEGGFWEEMKNDNKKGGKVGGGWGKDKGKGGRIIGADGRYEKTMPGGKKKKKMVEKAKAASGGDAKDGDGMSEREKKQKAKNKAARGNHHRKDRATKKTGGVG